jgi:hypothetical protein
MLLRLSMFSMAVYAHTQFVTYFAHEREVELDFS